MEIIWSKAPKLSSSPIKASSLLQSHPSVLCFLPELYFLRHHRLMLHHEHRPKWVVVILGVWVGRTGALGLHAPGAFALFTRDLQARFCVITCKLGFAQSLL